jgi:diadenosine tetraphosphate (Ap4A) HIT family hydrolase
VLVAPRDHREDVTDDFGLDEHLALQAVVHRVGEAVGRVVPTERLNVLILGSRQANSHVHWHVAPLPVGVPFERRWRPSTARPSSIWTTRSSEGWRSGSREEIYAASSSDTVTSS